MGVLERRAEALSLDTLQRPWSPMYRTHAVVVQAHNEVGDGDGNGQDAQNAVE